MKNYRKYLVAVVVTILLLAGVSQLQIKSVSQYNKEQKALSVEENKPSDEAAGTETVQNIGLDEKEGGEETSGNQETVQKNAEKDGSKGKSHRKKPAQITKKRKTKKKKTASVAAKKKTTSSAEADAAETKDKKSKVQKNVPKKNTEKSRKNETKKPAVSPADDEKGTYIYCNVLIDCSILLSHMDRLPKNVRKYVPENGILLQKSSVRVKQGASAYDVLTAACKANKIAYDAEYSSIYNTAYIKGIGYLYEKMAGDMSGWLYQVDGQLPNVGASRYTVKDGDSLSWTYTCSGRVGS